MLATALWLWLLLWFPAACVADRPRPYDQAVDNGTYGLYPVWSYMSEPNLTTAPRTQWPHWSPRCNDGRLNFITPRGEGMKTPGPMILDGNGDLVWFQFFDNEFGGQAYNLKVQQYRGQDYLTFWLGDDTVSGHGAGIYYMLDSSYEIAHKVNAAGDFQADLHEFLITPEDTALVTVYHKVNMSLASILPPEHRDDKDRTWVWDCLVQEINIETGELIFQWRALDHFNLTDTYRDFYEEGSFDGPWDWFHINSIAKDELGNYLISARYLHSIIYIDGKTGDVLWQLGGKHNSFMDIGSESSLSFAKQHDARFHELSAFPEIYTAEQQQQGVTQRLMTFFDNTFGDDISRGLLVELTYPSPQTSLEARDAPVTTAPNGTDASFAVQLLRVYQNPRGVRSMSQGSMQVIAGDRAKVLIGYGYDAVWTEFDIDGTVLCDAHFAAQPAWRQGTAQSYRAFKGEWTGQPKTRPKIAINETRRQMYMSWNGATEIAGWVVQSSDHGDNEGRDWYDVVKVQKHGFESVADLSASPVPYGRFLRAVALSTNGSVLLHGTSEALDRGEQYKRPTLMWNVAILGAMVAAASSLAYVVRRWRRRSLGRPVAGPVRWKHGNFYRRLSADV